jgi:hypothetical protein
MTGALYARRPNPVKAVQWRKHGDHPDVTPAVDWPGTASDTQGKIRIPGQGIMLVSPGDWIVDGLSVHNPHRLIIPAGRFAEDYQPYPTKERTMSEQDIEAEIVAKGKTAPRITPDMLDAEIADEDYHVFKGSCLTICVLTLQNGYSVVGQSACADPANFDAEIGRKIARENARNAIWPLLGFRLKDQLARGES